MQTIAPRQPVQSLDIVDVSADVSADDVTSRSFGPAVWPRHDILHVTSTTSTWAAKRTSLVVIGASQNGGCSSGGRSGGSSQVAPTKDRTPVEATARQRPKRRLWPMRLRSAVREGRGRGRGQVSKPSRPGRAPRSTARLSEEDGGLRRTRSQRSASTVPWSRTDCWLTRVRSGPWGSGVGDCGRVRPMFDTQGLPFACKICKRGGLTGTQVRPCSGCGIVRYCCEEHDREHRPTHENACRLFSAAPRSPAHDGASYHAWILRSARSFLAGGELSDELHGDAVQAWVHQPHCEICYSVDGPSVFFM